MPPYSLTVSGLGSGVRSIDGSCLPNSPLELPKDASPSDKRLNPAVKLSMVVIEDEQQLYTELGVAQQNGVALDYGVVHITADQKSALATQVKFDSQYIYFMVKKQVTHTDTISGTVSLSLEATKQIANGDIESFYANYGDRFINQLTSGSEFFLVFKWHLSSVAKYQGKKFGADINAKLLATEVSAALNASLSSNSSTQKLNKITQGGYWLHMAGYKEATTFVPDTSSVPNFISSIAKLLQVPPDLTAEVPLSFTTLPYANAVIKSDVTNFDETNTTTNKVKKADITSKLMRLEGHIRYLSGLDADVSYLIQRANEYLSLIHI